MVDTGLIIAAISKSWEALKRAREVSKRIEDAEMMAILADLSVELSEVKVQMADLLTENSQLKQQKDLRERLRKEGNVWHMDDPPKGWHTGPYCLTCTSDLPVSMLVLEEKYHCPKCNQYLPRPDVRQSSMFYHGRDNRRDMGGL